MKMEIRRDTYLNKLISKRHNGLIKVITGVRRCGKSYLLFELFREYLRKSQVPDDHIIEMAFDAYENKKYRDPEIFFPYLAERINDQDQYYVLLDEVQLLGDFESILNSLVRRKNVDVYVTGSNAKFLSKDIITEFRGRGDEVHMYPLTFAEFMSVYEGEKADGWRDYVLYGGIPLVLTFTTPDQKGDFLKSLFEETYISDIIGRNNVRNKAELEELLNILSSSIGSLTNPSKLSATFKKYIDTPSKYYFTDLGLRNARLNFRQVEETHAMENIIFNELKVRGYNVDVGVVVMNETDHADKKIRKQLEIDFVCNKGSKRYYIQSAFVMHDEKKMQQEERPLINTGDGFKKIIITKDAIAPLYSEEGVLVMSIFDFLLNPDSMDL